MQLIMLTILLFEFEHILVHDLSAKGLSTSSENLERLLLLTRTL